VDAPLIGVFTYDGVVESTPGGETQPAGWEYISVMEVAEAGFHDNKDRDIYRVLIENLDDNEQPIWMQFDYFSTESSPDVKLRVLPPDRCFGYFAEGGPDPLASKSAAAGEHSYLNVIESIEGNRSQMLYLVAEPHDGQGQTIDPDDFVCNPSATYSITGLVPVSGCPIDTYEPNDECEQPTPVDLPFETGGTVTLNNLTLNNGNDTDWFRYEGQLTDNSQFLKVTITVEHTLGVLADSSIGDLLQADFKEGDCVDFDNSNAQDSGDNGNGVATFEYVLGLGFPGTSVDKVIRITSPSQHTCDEFLSYSISFTLQVGEQ